MASIGDRVRLAMAKADVDQAELAEGVGCTQSAISQILVGTTQRSRFLPDIAQYLGVSLKWLKGETDDPEEGRVQLPSPSVMADQLDLVAITEIDQDYGMGGTFTGDHVELQIHHFPRLWVEQITTSPAMMLTLARGKGDSMDPTIRDRDMIIIDRSKRKLDETDAIWALTVGDIGMIKRLRLRGSTVVIQSDNDRVKDEEVSAEEVNLVGRVVFIGRRT
jgi:phage repressor protein C with HTH and peptisase S24 domain